MRLATVGGDAPQGNGAWRGRCISCSGEKRARRNREFFTIDPDLA
jgi:hypothetical protein